MWFSVLIFWPKFWVWVLKMIDLTVVMVESQVFVAEFGSHQKRQSINHSIKQSNKRINKYTNKQTNTCMVITKNQSGSQTREQKQTFMETHDKQMRGMHAAVMAQRTDEPVGSQTAITLVDAAAAARCPSRVCSTITMQHSRGGREGGMDGDREGGDRGGGCVKRKKAALSWLQTALFLGGV